MIIHFPKIKYEYTLVVALILLIASPVFYPVSAWTDHGSTERYRISSTPDLATNDYFTYELSAGLVRLLNGSVIYQAGENNIITINVSIIDASLGDSLSILIKYSGNLYDDTKGSIRMDFGIMITYSPDTGVCTVENGTAQGAIGTFYLFYNEDWSSIPFIISELQTRNVTAYKLHQDIPVAIRIMDELQLVEDFNCTYYDPIANDTSHLRRYDADTNVLVNAQNMVADAVLLGLGNISYGIGSLTLTDTNFDLGEAVEGVSISDSAPYLLAGAGIIVFIGIYIVIYRAQRKKEPKKAKGKRKMRNK